MTTFRHGGASRMNFRSPRAAKYIVVLVAVAFSAAVFAWPRDDTVARKTAQQRAWIWPPLPPVLRPNNPAWLGVEVRPLDQRRARKFRFPSYLQGVEIVSVAKGSPAARLPLQLAGPTSPGDLILSVDDQAVHSPAALRAALRRHRPGQQAVLSLVQPGERTQSVQVSITLDGHPTNFRNFE